MKHLKTFEAYVQKEHDIEEILKHYLHAAMWTEDFDDKYNMEEFSQESIEKSKVDIAKFLAKATPFLDGVTDEMIGHDLWLTRNGHGAGFWDRQNIEEEAGQALTDICKELGEVNVFENDTKDGLIIE